MTHSVADLINNIENGTLADAEQVFNDIMDLKAGNVLDAHRQQVAANMFGGPEELEDEESDNDFDDESDEDFSGEEDADV